jgi:hexulose-6-phosphate isomerase
MIADGGADRIREASAASGVAVRSVCADYFMEHPLVRARPAELKERLLFLGSLLARGGSLGIGRMVIPFVDASRIDTATEQAEVAAILRDALALAEPCGVELHLETSLAPADFASLLDRLPHPLLKVNYDSGNSASLGFSPRDEFRAYGARVGSVHIKDRVLGGSTVPLGTGQTDFPGLWEALRSIDYRGDFILQAARGTAGEEAPLAARNRLFVENGLVTHGMDPHGPRT